MLTNFLSNKFNVTVFQCLLYLVLGYMLSLHYGLGQLVVIAIVIVLINIITHIKGVSQGMFINEVIHRENKQFLKFMKSTNKKYPEYPDSDKDLN